MEEKALLINISTIIAKDLILDKSKITKRPFDYSNSTQQNVQKFLNEDDFSLDQFVYQMQKRIKTKHNHNKRGIKINLIKDLPENVFESSLHIRKRTMHKIFGILGPLIETSASNITRLQQFSKETIICLGIWKLATDEHFEEISRRFMIPLDICQNIIRKFWLNVSSNNVLFINWPKTLQEQNCLIEKFQKKDELKSFKNLVALLTVKSLDVFLESDDEEISVVFQIICDADQRIIDCYADIATRYEFANSPIAMKLEQKKRKMLPNGCYLIGDKNSTLKKYLVRPFEKPLNKSELAMNALFAKTAAITNSVMHKMIKRFNTLYALEANDIDQVRRILETICSIHNICLDCNDDCIPDSMEFDEGSSLRLKGSDIDPEGRRRRLDIMKDVLK